MSVKLYPYQQELMDAIKRDGKSFIRSLQWYGRALRPELWHLAHSDPCDDWSEALGLNGNGLYPKAVVQDYASRRDIVVVDFECFGIKLDCAFIDEYTLAPLAYRQIVGRGKRNKPIADPNITSVYDYQIHNKPKRKKL